MWLNWVSLVLVTSMHDENYNKRIKKKHLDSVAHVVQQAVVDGLADVADRPLGIGRGDDLVCAGCVFVGGEDADLPPSHLLFVDVHRLRT